MDSMPPSPMIAQPSNIHLQQSGRSGTPSMIPGRSPHHSEEISHGVMGGVNTHQQHLASLMAGQGAPPTSSSDHLPVSNNQSIIDRLQSPGMPHGSASQVPPGIGNMSPAHAMSVGSPAHAMSVGSPAHAMPVDMPIHSPQQAPFMKNPVFPDSASNQSLSPAASAAPADRVGMNDGNKHAQKQHIRQLLVRQQEKRRMRREQQQMQNQNWSGESHQRPPPPYPANAPSDQISPATNNEQMNSFPGTPGTPRPEAPPAFVNQRPQEQFNMTLEQTDEAWRQGQFATGLQRRPSDGGNRIPGPGQFIELRRFEQGVRMPVSGPPRPRNIALLQEKLHQRALQQRTALVGSNPLDPYDHMVRQQAHSRTPTPRQVMTHPNFHGRSPMMSPMVDHPAQQPHLPFQQPTPPFQGQNTNAIQNHQPRIHNAMPAQQAGTLQSDLHLPPGQDPAMAPQQEDHDAQLEDLLSGELDLIDFAGTDLDTNKHSAENQQLFKDFGLSDEALDEMTTSSNTPKDSNSSKIENGILSTAPENNQVQSTSTAGASLEKESDKVPEDKPAANEPKQTDSSGLPADPNKKEETSSSGRKDAPKTGRDISATVSSNTSEESSSKGLMNHDDKSATQSQGTNISSDKGSKEKTVVHTDITNTSASVPTVPLSTSASVLQTSTSVPVSASPSEALTTSTNFLGKATIKIEATENSQSICQRSKVSTAQSGQLTTTISGSQLVEKPQSHSQGLQDKASSGTSSVETKTTLSSSVSAPRGGVPTIDQIAAILPGPASNIQSNSTSQLPVASVASQPTTSDGTQLQTSQSSGSAHTNSLQKRQRLLHEQPLLLQDLLEKEKREQQKLQQQSGNVEAAISGKVDPKSKTQGSDPFLDNLDLERLQAEAKMIAKGMGCISLMFLFKEIFISHHSLTMNLF